MKKILLLIGGLLILNYIFSYEVRFGERPEYRLDELPKNAYYKTHIYIKFSDDLSDYFFGEPARFDDNGIVSFGIPEVDNLNQKYRIYDFVRLFDSPAFKEEHTDRHRAWGFHLWYEIKVPKNSDIIEIVKNYKKLEAISVAEPEFKKELHDFSINYDPELFENRWTPDDPLLSEQWHYHNTGQAGGTPGADISLLSAWDIEKGYTEVIVAIVDSGIQYDHPDLAANMWEETGFNFVTNSNVINPGSHGSHVAGTISAVNNNSIGVSGIAGGSGYGDGVRLMSCQVFDSDNSGGFHNAYVYAADNGAAISQNSWGYTTPGNYNQNVLDAIDYFNLNGGGEALNGGITITSAGNSNSNQNFYPGYYSGVFSVAATNNNDVRSYYSNYGSYIDISAPGGETIYVSAAGVLSCIVNNNYSFYQGTSMACPHVSGVAALIISFAYGHFNPVELADILRDSADDHYSANPGYIGMLGSGRLNAHQALVETIGYVGSVLNPVNFTAVPEGTSRVILNWERNFHEDEVIIVWSEDEIIGTPADGTIYQAGDYLPGGGEILYIGSEISFIHEDLLSATQCHYKAFSYNNDLLYSLGRTATAKTESTVIFRENFGISDQLPINWEIIDNEGNGQVWEIGVFEQGLEQTAGFYAFINSNIYGEGNLQNTDLISPAIDISTYDSVFINFTHYFRQFGNFSSAKLDYSLDDGSNWIEKASWTVTSANPSVFSAEISGLSGFDEIKFRWSYTASWSWFWCVDEIIVSVGGIPELPVPTNLVAEVENSSVVLNWDSSGSFDDHNLIFQRNQGPNRFVLEGYNIYRNNKRINSSLVSDIFFIDVNVEDGEDHFYNVTAQYSGMESVFSETAEIHVGFFLPNPNDLSAIVGYGYVDLSWSEPTSSNRDGFMHRFNLLGYNVYRNQVLVNENIVTEPDYTDNNVFDGIEYLYYVTAVYEQGESQSSNSVLITAEGPQLNAPQNLTAFVDNNTVNLSWESPSLTFLSEGKSSINQRQNFRTDSMSRELYGYNLYRNNEMVNTEVLTESFYLDEGLDENLYYTYYVTAVYQEGESFPSNHIAITLEEFAGGLGTMQDPYLISNFVHLNNIRYYTDIPGLHFKLIEHIDLNGLFEPGQIFYNNGKGWEPIGCYENTFSSTLNGNGKIISGLYINRSDQNKVGLIWETLNADIYNLELKDIVITGGNFVGGLAGNIRESTIVNCSVSGTITGNERVGLIVGSLSASALNNSDSTGEVFALKMIGGLIGYSIASEISNSSSFVTVVAEDDMAGGLIGYNMATTVDNCHSLSNVSGVSSVGGLIGFNMNNSHVSDSSSQSVVIGSGDAVGGLLGLNNLSIISYSETISDVTGYGLFTGGLIGQNNNGSQVLYCKSVSTVYNFSSNAGGLVGDNNNHSSIINSSSTGSVNGIENTGGLVGRNTSMSSITKSFSTARVDGTDNVGGIAGRNYMSEITSSFFAGSISGDSFVGGIVGKNLISEIENSFNNASVAGFLLNVGGLVGSNSHSSVINSYSVGDVFGTAEKVGGLVGANNDQSVIEYSYSTGLVEGIDLTGGLVGFNDQSSSVIQSYWDIQKSGHDQSDGGSGAMGRLTEEMTYPYSNDTFTGWDFENIWFSDTESLINDGYPYLQDFYLPPSHLTVYAGDSQVVLTWNSPSPISPDGFRVYRNGEMIYENLQLFTDYTDNEVINGTTYSYYVTAIYNNYGESSPSSTVYTTPLAPPFALTAVIEADNNVFLEWQSPEVFSSSRGVKKTVTLTGFKIFRNNQLIKQIDSQNQIFLDQNLIDGVYTYHVIAIYGDLESIPSNTAEVKILGTESVHEVVVKTELGKNYPNPFNPYTRIVFSLKETGRVVIEVYNIKGQKVAVIADKDFSSGNHTVTWNGRDLQGNKAGSGVYFYRMTTSTYDSVKKMLMIK